jgi:hypothetical protein
MAARHKRARRSAVPPEHAPGALILNSPDELEVVEIVNHPDSGVSLSFTDSTLQGTEHAGMSVVTVLLSANQTIELIRQLHRVEIAMYDEIGQGRGGRPMARAELLSEEEAIKKFTGQPYAARPDLRAPSH